MKKTFWHNNNLLLDVASLHSQLRETEITQKKGESRVGLILSFLKQIIAKEKERYAGTILATTAVREKVSEIEHNSKNF